MQLNRCAAGIHHDVACFNKTSFFKYLDLVFHNVVKAVLLCIIKSTNAPAEAKLVDQGSFLTKNKERGFWTVTAKHKRSITTLRHTDECFCIYISCKFTCIVTNSVTEERRRVGLRSQFFFSVIVIICFFYLHNDLS